MKNFLHVGNDEVATQKKIDAVLSAVTLFPEANRTSDALIATVEALSTVLSIEGTTITGCTFTTAGDLDDDEEKGES